MNAEKELDAITNFSRDPHGRLDYHPLLHVRQGTPWTDDDMEYLCKYHEIEELEMIALALERTTKSVATKLTQIKKQGKYEYYKNLNHYYVCGECMGKTAVPQLDKDIVKIISETAIQEYRKEQQKAQKEKQDKRLHNVKLLLESYRKFKKLCNARIEEIEKIDYETYRNFEDFDEWVVPAIRDAKERTVAMVVFTEKMVYVYKQLCDVEGEVAQRQYDVIHNLYIADVPMKITDLAQKHLVDGTIIYKDRNKAYEELAKLIFGVDVIGF